jgi:hypothetical protein
VPHESGVLLDRIVVAEHPDVALGGHEVEDARDGLRRRLGDEGDLEVEVAGLRVQVLSLRHQVIERRELLDPADGGQVTDEGQRVHAVAQAILAETQAQMQPTPASGSGRQLLSCGYRL